MIEKIHVEQQDISVEFTGSFAEVSWPDGITNNNYTAIIIEQCNDTGGCVQHDVTDNAKQILKMSVSDGNTFYLVIYQDGLEAYRSKTISDKNDGNDKSSK